MLVVSTGDGYCAQSFFLHVYIRALTPGRFSFKLFQNSWKVFEKIFYVFPGVWQAEAETNNAVAVGINPQSLYGIRASLLPAEPDETYTPI